MKLTDLRGISYNVPLYREKTFINAHDASIFTYANFPTMNNYVAVMMGVTTATAGGVVRDILSDQVPFILQKEIYATACILGGLLYCLLYGLGLNEPLTAVISAVLVVLVRVAAIHRHWSLPLAKE